MIHRWHVSAMFLPAAVLLAASEAAAGVPSSTPPVERPALVFLIAGQSSTPSNPAVPSAIKPIRKKQFPSNGKLYISLSNGKLVCFKPF